jgi:hypothetical protein
MTHSGSEDEALVTDQPNTGMSERKVAVGADESGTNSDAVVKLDSLVPEEADHPESASNTRAEAPATDRVHVDWGKRRNAMGLLNKELMLIVVTAAFVGVLVTLGTSILGVR